MRKYYPRSIGLLLLVVLCPFWLMAQQMLVTGQVLDSASRPLEGVSITVKGTSTGTVSGADGHYSIKAKKGQILVFSSLGKTSQEVTLGSTRFLTITLSEGAASSLNDVVVTGYMVQRKADLTGAISVVPTEELDKNHGATNVLDALQGVVPGMHITTDGNPASSNITVQIRGLTSVNGASPLIVIDGMPSTTLNLRDINPNNIASFQVLKDAASASIYGAQGAAGVILIETKKGTAGKTRITYNGSFGF
jgi:TonB-dependent SusC/RagA subfamily outer membrane receptor